MLVAVRKMRENYELEKLRQGARVQEMLRKVATGAQRVRSASVRGHQSEKEQTKKKAS